MNTASSRLFVHRSLTGARHPLAVWVLLGLSLVASAASALAGTWAAIAVDSETGHYGYGKGYATRAAAEEKAMQECGRNAKVVMYANDGVIALAEGDKPGAWGTGHKERRGWAEEQAIKNCSEYTSGAHVVVIIDTEE